MSAGRVVHRGRLRGEKGSYATAQRVPRHGSVDEKRRRRTRPSTRAAVRADLRDQLLGTLCHQPTADQDPAVTAGAHHRGNSLRLDSRAACAPCSQYGRVHQHRRYATLADDRHLLAPLHLVQYLGQGGPRLAHR